MTQADLAKKLGVTQQVVSRIESAENNLTLSTLIKLLAVYGLVLKIDVRKRSNRQLGKMSLLLSKSQLNEPDMATYSAKIKKSVLKKHKKAK